MTPDWSNIEKALRNKETSKVPLYEFHVDLQIVDEIMGYPKLDWESPDVWRTYWKRYIDFYTQMGYDHMSMEVRPNFVTHSWLLAEDSAQYSKGQRGWIDEHSGPIQTREDMERAPWPTGEDAITTEWFDMVAEMLPEGMKVIGGASGGPFEHATFLMGFENLAMALYTEPDFVEELFNRIGETLVASAKKLAKLDCIGAYRIGDDLGYKTGTMISPDHLRKYVFPWQKKIVEAVHEAGKPFLLHSCGQLADVMDDIIDYVGVDAKHSFEDVIMPVTEAKKRWGDRVALFGGIDIHFLATSTPSEIEKYTLDVLKQCSAKGGYALGSGNTIANYIPVKNYLAMIDALKKFNGN